MLKIKPPPKRFYIFELAKSGGFLFYFIVSTFALVINPFITEPVNLILIIILFRSVSGYISITILFWILKNLNDRNLVSQKIFLFLFAPCCYIISLVWLVINESSYALFRSERFAFESILFVKAFSFLFIVIAFAGLYFLIIHWLNLKKQKEMTLQATSLANEAQLQMLRYQVNPHFLFNALNTIRSMVEEDKVVARNMITELSAFFRYSLSQEGTTDTVENELNAIKNYLAIQKIRFEEKLNVVYDIDDKLYQLRIPFFIILPLVENAIKFGLQSGKAPLNIRIIARANEHLEISVHNTGELVECNKSEEGTKTGIENTKKRLSLYFPDGYSFKLFKKDSWVIAQIIIFNYKNQLPG